MKQEDLIVGKWYVCSKWCATKAAKFLKVDSTNGFICSEHITTDGKHEVKQIAKDTYSEDFSLFSEVPLSDIRKYLPQEHPDLKATIGLDKEDLIIGRWYKNTTWTVTEGIKFSGFSAKGSIESSEQISNGSHRIVKNVWTRELEYYVEVPFSNIRQYLPKDYVNIEIIPRYVQLLAGFDDHHTGEVFDTNNPVPNYRNWTPSWTWKDLLTKPEYSKFFNPTPKEKYDSLSLSEFPELGVCKGIHPLLEKYLTSIGKIQSTNNNDDKNSIIWNSTYWWYGELRIALKSDSNRKEYKIEQLNKFINPNFNQDGRKSSPSNQVQRLERENRRTNITGTTGIRNRGQQGATGSRLEGNIKTIERGQESVVRVKRSKNIGLHKHP